MRDTRARNGAVLLVAVGLMSCIDSDRTPGPPRARVDVVVDEYHGVEVADPYRWLEDRENREVLEWSDGQNAHARSVLDTLPGRQLIEQRVTQIMRSPSVIFYMATIRAGTLFAMKRQPPNQQGLLVRFDDLDRPETEHVVVDPNQLDPAGGTTIDWYVPSPDGRMVGVSLSRGGSESGSLHLFDVATGELVEEPLPRVNGGTAGGDMAWLADGSGFFYTRYPRDGERPAEEIDFFQQVYLHRLGQPTGEDRYELGRDFPRIAEIRLESENRSGRLLATVQDGDSARFALHLREADGRWRKLSDFEDRALQATFGPGDQLLILSTDGADRGQILRVPADATDLTDARVVVPESDGAIGHSFYNWYSPSFVATENRLYVIYQVGGPAVLRVFDSAGKPLDAPEQLPISDVYSLTPIGRDRVLFANASYVDAKTWYSYDPATSETRKLRWSTELPVSFSGLRVEREFARSPDGTRVPVNIVMPALTELDGSHPIVVTGYGGYGLSMTPFAVAHRKLLLEQGVLFAEANLRGGGEFGESWHEQGRLTHKQNVFDDFAAVLEHLVARGYTSPDRIAILGGSNGGLLMGAVMTQHPQAVSAVISHVGIYDSIRSELSANGIFNVPEFGTVHDPEQFAALYAYSPYHNVEAGTAYPATLFLTGANDPRVDPMHSRKMTARLQAASTADVPILLRTSTDTGHGGGTPLDEQIQQLTDAYAFAMHFLGVTYRPIEGG